MNTTTKSKNIYILSCKINCLKYIEVLQYIEIFLKSNKQHYLVTPNPEIVLLAQNDNLLIDIINNADISVADGSGLMWAAKYNSLKLTKNTFFRPPQAILQTIYSLFLFALFKNYSSDIISEQITGTDLVPEICKICSKNKKKVFFLGAAPGVAKKAATNLKLLYPNLIVAGTYAGPQGIWKPKHDQKVQKIINKAKPDCLLIAYGAPKQEKWIYRNLSKLKNTKLIIGIGGAFDFIAGEVSLLGGQKAVRAPQWIRSLHLEWLHRLYCQPDRIDRIFKAIFVFPWRVTIAKISKIK